MRTSFPVFLTIFFMLSYGQLASAQVSTPDIFQENLSFGSKNIKIIALQHILNQDPATRVATTGPGSIGNETEYFGLLTKSAVARFQMKYADEVLLPVELTRGNGYVGYYTRRKLNTLSLSIFDIKKTSSTTLPQSPEPSSGVLPNIESNSTSPDQTDATENPNLKNLDKFLSALNTVATKQGFSAETIATLKEQALQRVATTTDLRATFLKMAQEKSPKTANGTSFIDRTLATITDVFDAIFTPKHARAAISAPFGGALLYAFPCDGGVWNITLEPLPPSYPALLSYESKSQIYAYKNIPLTRWLLGNYLPIPMVYCWVGIYPYPSQGFITPMVGSSLSPL